MTFGGHAVQGAACSSKKAQNETCKVIREGFFFFIPLFHFPFLLWSFLVFQVERESSDISEMNNNIPQPRLIQKIF